MAWATKSVGTRHTCNEGNGPAFGHKTAGCPRCDELSSGAKPRKGWNDDKVAAAQHFARELREHDCEKRNCGPICTAFDW